MWFLSTKRLVYRHDYCHKETSGLTLEAIEISWAVLSILKKF